jgi:hypothetical protein
LLNERKVAAKQPRVDIHAMIRIIRVTRIGAVAHQKLGREIKLKLPRASAQRIRGLVNDALVALAHAAQHCEHVLAHGQEGEEKHFLGNVLAGAVLVPALVPRQGEAGSPCDRFHKVAERGEGFKPARRLLAQALEFGVDSCRHNAHLVQFADERCHIGEALENEKRFSGDRVEVGVGNEGARASLSSRFSGSSETYML